MIQQVPVTNCKNCGAVLADGQCEYCGARYFYTDFVHLRTEEPKHRSDNFAAYSGALLQFGLTAREAAEQFGRFCVLCRLD